MDALPARRRWWTLSLFLLGAVMIVAVPVGASRFTGAQGATHTFHIPAGTATRVAAGEDVTIIPSDLRLRLRDRLVVINADDVTHQIASITVGPGEQVETRFSEAVSLSGFCSVHPSGQITIEVDGAVRPGVPAEP